VHYLTIMIDFTISADAFTIMIEFMISTDDVLRL